MLGQNFHIIFFLRKPKNSATGAMPIFLRITIDGVPSEMSTGRKCDVSLWDKKAEKMIGNKAESKELNQYLSLIKMKVYQARLTLLESTEPLTATALKTVLTGKVKNGRTILEVFKKHNDQMFALVGKEFAAGTMERYKTSLEHTRSFIKWKYNLDDFEIIKLNYEFIADYEFWLKSVRNCNHNSAIKYISNFRKIVNTCIRNGWLTKDPFLGFKMTKREVERTALSMSELESIAAKKFVPVRLDQVRDIFLFCCFTGLAYADIYKLKRTEIREGVNGEQWIFTSRQKTDTASRIPILPSAKLIVDKYANHAQCLITGVVLPVLSNQKMNAYLKEISDLCGITQNLTFHIARHTFATTITLNNNVPIETVSKMLGHKNLKTTQQYAKVLDIKVGADMDLLKEKLEKQGS